MPTYTEAATAVADSIVNALSEEKRWNIDNIGTILTEEVYNGPLYVTTDENAMYSLVLPGMPFVYLAYYGDEGVTDQWAGSASYEAALSYVRECMADSTHWYDADSGEVLESEPEGYMDDCTACEGEGDIPGDDDETPDCAYCHGSGRMFIEPDFDNVYEVDAQDVNRALIGTQTYDNLF